MPLHGTVTNLLSWLLKHWRSANTPTLLLELLGTRVGHEHVRTDSWFMRSPSVTPEFISAFTVTNQGCVSPAEAVLWGRKNNVIPGWQVHPHRFSGVTASSFEVVPVGFPDKCKLAPAVLLANWKPCSSSHHVSETELSRLKVCAELTQLRTSLYLWRVRVYLPVKGCRWCRKCFLESSRCWQHPGTF